MVGACQERKHSFHFAVYLTLRVCYAVHPAVAVEELVALVETDKVTVEVRSPAAGTITALMTEVEATVLVGADLLEIDVGVGEAGGDTVAAAAESTPAAPAAPAAAATSPWPAPANASRMARIHPSGKPSLMTFPPRGAAAAAAATAAAVANAPTSTKLPPPKPKVETPRAGTIAYSELPARFRRPLISGEEMEAIQTGGADFLY